MNNREKAQEIADRLRNMGGVTPLSEAGKIYAILALADALTDQTSEVVE